MTIGYKIKIYIMYIVININEFILDQNLKNEESLLICIISNLYKYFI